MSWRLLGQEEYLLNKKLIKVNVFEYENKFRKDRPYKTCKRWV